MDPAVSFMFGGDDRDQPSLGTIDLKHLNEPTYRGPWLRGNQLPMRHPGYCTDLRDPLVKFWVALPGSEYACIPGHPRTIPAHGGARYEYIYCLTGELAWRNAALEKDRIAFGTGPVKLDPWTTGVWTLTNPNLQAMGLTLAFAEPTPSARVGHGPLHELHILGLPGHRLIERLMEPDHLPDQQWDMLLMIFAGTLMGEDLGSGGSNLPLTPGSFLYYPAAERYPQRPIFSDPSPDFRAAVLFYIAP